MALNNLCKSSESKVTLRIHLSMILKNQNILVISNERWGDIWYSKHNYAYELSKMGNKVFFINSPDPYQIKHFFHNPITVEPYNENLSIVKYHNRLPARYFKKQNDAWVVRDLRNYLKSIGITDFIIWSFDPIQFGDLRRFGAKYNIFHCVDRYKDGPWREISQQYVKNIDLFFSTAPTYIEEFKPYTQAPMRIVPHGISSDEFIISKEEEKIFDLPFKDYIFYLGVIDDRTDYDLLEQTLQRYPEEKFVYMGPIRQNSNPIAHKLLFEKPYPNLYLPGPRHFKTTKVFIRNAKTCLNLLNPHFPGNLIHHHKTLTYLAQGRPVFSRYCEAHEEADSLMYMYQNNEEFFQLFDNFIKNGEATELIHKRIEFAKRYTFENILKNANRLIEELTPHLQ